MVIRIVKKELVIFPFLQMVAQHECQLINKCDDLIIGKTRDQGLQQRIPAEEAQENGQGLLIGLPV